MSDTAAAAQVAEAASSAAAEAVAEVATEAAADASVDAALEAAAEQIEDAQAAAAAIAGAAVEAEREHNIQDLAEGVAQCQNVQAQQSGQIAAMAESLTALQTSTAAIMSKLEALPVLTIPAAIPQSELSIPPASDSPVAEAITTVLPEASPAASEAARPVPAKRHRWI